MTGGHLHRDKGRGLSVGYFYFMDDVFMPPPLPQQTGKFTFNELKHKKYQM